MSALSLNNFNEELLIEHLEEASYLYETRLVWREDSELSWTDVAEVEQRLESHIDALVVSAKALGLMFEAFLNRADFGEKFALACFCCRTGESVFLQKVISRIDPNDEKQVKAIVEALHFECPANWIAPVSALLEAADEKTVRVLANIVACTGTLPSGRLVELLQKVHISLLPQAIQQVVKQCSIKYCSQPQQAEVIPILNTYLVHECFIVKNIAAINLYKLGIPEVAERLLKYKLDFAITVAVIGTGNQLDALSNLIQSSTVIDKQALIAIGLIGNIANAKFLLKLLEDQDHCIAASQALALIFGVTLTESVFVEEDFEKEDLFDHELTDFSKGILPKHPSGKAYGESIDRICCDGAQWVKWFQKNYDRFDRLHRYRLGEVYTPESVRKSLRSEVVSNEIRQWVFQEIELKLGGKSECVFEDRVSKQLSLC